MTLLCGWAVLTGLILFIAAVIGLGDTGRIFAPISALAKDDFPALNAPNKAMVKPLLCKRCALFCRSQAVLAKPGRSAIAAAALYNLAAVDFSLLLSD